MTATTGEIPPPTPEQRANPVQEGLALIVAFYAGPERHPVDLLACTECGVLLWDVERHWRDAHNNRLQALRAIRAREARGRA